ncbi:hypothetical protein [Methylocystis sp.]|uniref:hypothetical protein n=1 Tax=Methylocystis sp. TaxID=1911079 RepID=UPI0026000E90|nr:hypothetical protein [Methylocystis sp.]
MLFADLAQRVAKMHRVPNDLSELPSVDIDYLVKVDAGHSRHPVGIPDSGSHYFQFAAILSIEGAREKALSPPR